MQIGYLGPEGSYSHLAAKTMCPEAQLTAYQSFPLVMASLTSGDTDAIIVPIENTLNGGVLQVIDLLQATDNVCAVREYSLKIDHRLVTRKGSNASGIKNIYSHAQALEQCAKYLAVNFPNAKLVSVQSTAASLDMIKSGEDAAIAGAHLSREGLVLSGENIADADSNFTHFLLVKRGAVQDTARSEKIYFSVTCKNNSGGLYNLLNGFYKFEINMTKIQSRPVKEVPDEYRFFIEIEGDYSSAKVKDALKAVKATATSFKLLGCY